MIAVYVTGFCIVLILMLLSRHETPPSDAQVSALAKPFRRAAVYLYRKRWGAAHFRNRRGEGIFPGSAVVINDFSLLEPSAGLGRKVTLYYIDKIQNLLIFLTTADVLALAVWLSSAAQRSITDEGTVMRPDYGASAIELTAEVISAADETISYGEYVISVEAREYTEAELEAMASELLSMLPQLILGGNESLDEVSEDLDLPEKVEGYPFELSWRSSRYGRIGSDGTVYTEGLEEGEGESVILTVILSSQEWTCEDEIGVQVVAAPLSEEERMAMQIEEALADSSGRSATAESIFLPDMIDGVAVSWKEVTEDGSATVFLLILFAGAAVFFLRDRDLHQRVRDRQRQMAMDYPQIVSKLILFLGAGMSVRNAFARISDGYLEELRKGGERHYVYEEILLVCREMDSGISESTAYAHLGLRCHTRQYTKFCSLLTQNLRKGNSALIQTLQEEADLAFEDRKRLARQLGEEAGTRMLLPMIMMLGVTLMIIMIPALLSFSM